MITIEQRPSIQLDPTAKLVSESRSDSSRIMDAADQNIFGKVSGTTIFDIMDKVGGECAIHHSGCPCVTAYSDAISFRRPVNVGDKLHAEAHLTYVGDTSMEARIRLERENIFTGEREHSHTGYIVFVALGKDGKPTKVPRLIPETAEEQREFDRGEQRERERKNRRNCGDFE